ncbi:MAG: aminoacyl-tRNA deacylase [Candidatus Bipolaricaulota bacterium]
MLAASEVQACPHPANDQVICLIPEKNVYNLAIWRRGNVTHFPRRLTMDVENEVLEKLEKSGCWYEHSHHEPVRTSQEAAEVRGVPLNTGVKAMVLKTDKGFVLGLVPADRRVNLEKVSSLEDSEDIRLAEREEVEEVTGTKIGGVPPFGHETSMKTYIDPRILENEYVNFNAGKRTSSIKMKGGDLPRCIEKSFVEEIAS